MDTKKPLVPETHKPQEPRELSEKELDHVVGGIDATNVTSKLGDSGLRGTANRSLAIGWIPRKTR